MLQSKLNYFHLHGHFLDSKLSMCMELAPLGFALSHCCCSMSRGKLKTGLLKSWINRWSLIFIQYSINRQIFPRPFDFNFVISGKSYIFTQDYQIHPPPRWRSGRAFASHGGNQYSISGRDRPQVVTAPLPKGRQQVWVSRVLGDDHYEGLHDPVRVTVGVAR